jgi:Zn-dependent protease with chaperone function
MRYIATFFNSYPGMYVAQSFCHSFIAAVVADRAMRSWNVYDPLVRQRFGILVILFPIFSFPLYQLIDAGRSSPQFRLEALFDANRWLTFDTWGMFPIGLLFLVVLASTALVFLLQEMIPVLKHALESRSTGHEGRRRAPDPFIERASRELSIEPPDVLVLDDDDPALFSTTGKQAVIYISSGLAEALTTEQLQAALAHEVAHIARNKRPLLMIVFVLRVILFFNPVVLVKFRRAVRDEEKICDDLAVSVTGNPKALAGALEKFYQKPAEAPSLDRQKLTAFTSSLEEHSYNLHLESRIKRLREGPSKPENGLVPLIAALLAIAVLNYFIV